MSNLNNRGFTLVELLATLVISVIIMTLVGTIIVKAFDSNNRTAAETQLRDEADLIMAKLNRDLFPLNSKDIEKIDVCTNPPGGCTSGVWILLKDGNRIGFQNDQLLSPSGNYSISASNVELLTNYKICYKDASNNEKCNVATPNKSATYKISFELKNTKRNISTKFENEFSIVYTEGN